MTRNVRHICPRTNKFRYAGPSEARFIAEKTTQKNRKTGHANPVVEPCMGWHVGHPVKPKVTS